MMSNPKSGQWQTVEVLEDDEALPDTQRKEFSYPYMITVDGNDAHLAYTWDRKKIRHRYFSGAWLKQALSKVQTQEVEVQRSEAQQ